MKMDFDYPFFIWKILFDSDDGIHEKTMQAARNINELSTTLITSITANDQ